MGWKIELIDDIVVVVMNSNRMNLINNMFLNDLNDAFDTIENEYSENAVVLTSGGDVFSAGLDITQSYPLFKEGDIDKIQEWYEQFRDSMLRIFRFKNPLIAAVNGHAIAGGLVLALCCDFRISVGSNAKFGLNEVTIGFPLPSVIAEIVIYSLGASVTERLVFDGHLFEPENALKLGFFHKLSEKDDMIPIAVEYAKQYNKPQIAAYSYSKMAMRQSVIRDIENYSFEFDKELPGILSSENTVESFGKLLESLKNKK